VNYCRGPMGGNTAQVRRCGLTSSLYFGGRKAGEEHARRVASSADLRVGLRGRPSLGLPSGFQVTSGSSDPHKTHSG
jgi:hypothetical protein